MTMAHSRVSDRQDAGDKSECDEGHKDLFFEQESNSK